MTTTLAGVVTSPVQMADRKALGIKPGDTVRVHQKIVDKGKTRLQVFEGIVLARKHGDEPGATFTVRKVASGVGVEKIYPLYSPLIEQIEIVKRSKVRRAKLYFIREKVSREIKRQMRRMSLVSMATEAESDVTARAAAEEKVAREAAEAAETAAREAEEKIVAEAAAKAEAEALAAAPVEEAAPEVVATAEVAPADEAPVAEVAEAEKKD